MPRTTCSTFVSISRNLCGEALPILRTLANLHPVTSTRNPPILRRSPPKRSGAGLVPVPWMHEGTGTLRRDRAVLTGVLRVVRRGRGVDGEGRAGPVADAPRGPCSQLRASRPGRPSASRDYTVVIRRAAKHPSASRARVAAHATLAHGTGARPQCVGRAAGGGAGAPSRGARPEGQGRGRLVQRDGLPLGADRDGGALGGAAAALRPRARTARTRRSPAARCSRATSGPASTAAPTAENLDHVVPKSRGGLHAWENVVAACRRCNAKKEDRTPAEAGFHLARQPFAPARRVPPHPRPPRARLGALPPLDPSLGPPTAAPSATDLRLPHPTPSAAVEQQFGPVVH